MVRNLATRKRLISESLPVRAGPPGEAMWRTDPVRAARRASERSRARVRASSRWCADGFPHKPMLESFVSGPYIIIYYMYNIICRLGS